MRTPRRVATHLGVLEGAEAFDVVSDAAGTGYRVVAALRDRGDGRAPVALYAPDAASSFGTIVETVGAMQGARMLPSILVVGIGYPSPGVEASIPLRYRDLTPTADPRWSDPSASEAGGAARFLRFLRTELQPWVRSIWSTAADEDAYVGHSLGGLFGADTLFREPATFRRYGLSSPSFWWDGEAIAALEAAYAAQHDDLAASVFLSVGGDEGFAGAAADRARMTARDRAFAEAHPFPHDMVDVVGRVAAGLAGRRYPSLRLRSEVLVGENHATAWPTSLTRSLRFLFEPA